MSKVNYSFLTFVQFSARETQKHFSSYRHREKIGFIITKKKQMRNAIQFFDSANLFHKLLQESHNHTKNLPDSDSIQGGGEGRIEKKIEQSCAKYKKGCRRNSSFFAFSI
jgi:hypothetical protein